MNLISDSTLGGRVVLLNDREKAMFCYVDISDFSNSLAVGQPVIIRADGTYNAKAVKPETSSRFEDIGVFTGFPKGQMTGTKAAATADGYYLFYIVGKYQALIDTSAGALTVGQPLKITNGGTAFVTVTSGKASDVGAIAILSEEAEQDTAKANLKDVILSPLGAKGQIA